MAPDVGPLCVPPLCERCEREESFRAASRLTEPWHTRHILTFALTAPGESIARDPDGSRSSYAIRHSGQAPGGRPGLASSGPRSGTGAYEYNFVAAASSSRI